tara:strand:+ start:4283 stop:5278 length:996 start_codon:yes stop_codon:yes gene_type:complete
MIFSNKKINSELKEQLIKDEKIMADLSNFLEFGYKAFNITAKQKGVLIKTNSHMGNNKDIDAEDLAKISLITNHKNHYVNHAYDSITNCCKAIQKFRKKRKNRSAIYTNKRVHDNGKILKVFAKERSYDHGFFNGQSIHDKHGQLTSAFAKQWWEHNHSRTNIAIDVNSLSRSTRVDAVAEGRSANYRYYERTNELGLAPSWFKNVFMKGLATTTYQSKIAFVANAKPYPLERLSASGLSVYKIDLVTCHDGILFLEKDLWFLAYETSPSVTEVLENTNSYSNNIRDKDIDNNIRYQPAITINCASDNFRRAENVMNGRVQRNMLKAMGVS